MTEYPFDKTSHKKISDADQLLHLNIEKFAHFVGDSEPLDWIVAVPVLREATETVLNALGDLVPVSKHVDELSIGVALA